MKKRGLGRGLDELLGESKKDSKLANITSLGINEIIPGKSQPRGPIEEKTIFNFIRRHSIINKPHIVYATKGYFNPHK